jgi:hypothetical protein
MIQRATVLLLIHIRMQQKSDSIHSRFIIFNQRWNANTVFDQIFVITDPVSGTKGRLADGRRVLVIESPRMIFFHCILFYFFFPSENISFHPLTSACLPQIFFTKLKKRNKEGLATVILGENERKQEKNRSWQTCGRRVAKSVAVD